ncbi:MAG: AAA family ATPase [Chitinophagales bacterium]
MKIKKIELSNFKQFVSKKTFDFIDENEDIPDITLILGNNGSGKTSLLQAIVLVTASASREGFLPENLNWAGFEYRLIETGRIPLYIRCEYVFTEEELEATYSYAEELIKRGVKLYTPSKQENVCLNFDYKDNKSLAGDSKKFYQFSGYQYAKRLVKFSENKNKLFDKVGNIYWYTEQRTSYSLSNLLDSEKPQLDYIRNFLGNSYAYHVDISNGNREGGFDFYESLHTLYKKVFPERCFIGSAPRFDVFEKMEAPDFFLSDGCNQYELAEMSAGERAIFPILMDFARWNINHSIIIIDEIELHLHPPLQQALIRALPKIGNGNQFIITSHSNSVAAMFSEDQIIRL